MRTTFLLLLSLCVATAIKIVPKEQTVKTLEDPLLKKFIATEITPEQRAQLDTLTESVLRNKKRTEQVRPLIIIPSLIGNRIEVKLENADTVHWYCYNNEDWYTIWFDKYEFFPLEQNCFGENFKLKRSVEGVYTAARNGVSSRIPHWGSVESCDFLDTGNTLPVWNEISTILRKYGYVDRFNLRAAPYEWRAGPDGMTSYFQNLKDLFEETYTLNGNISVAATALSMGSPYFILFLNTMQQSWKDKYVHSFTSLSGAFGGSSFALSVLALPQTQYGPASNLLGDIASSWGSIVYLLPSPYIFNDNIFLYTKSQNYTAPQFQKLFQDANKTATVETLRALVPMQKFGAPGIKINCVYGYGVPTEGSYSMDALGGPWKANNEDGDGTCLTEALKSCQLWSNQQKEAVNLYPIFNMTHGQAVFNAGAINVLLKELGI